MSWWDSILDWGKKAVSNIDMDDVFKAGSKIYDVYNQNSYRNDAVEQQRQMAKYLYDDTMNYNAAAQKYNEMVAGIAGQNSAASAAAARARAASAAAHAQAVANAKKREDRARMKAINKTLEMIGGNYDMARAAFKPYADAGAAVLPRHVEMTNQGADLYAQAMKALAGQRLPTTEQMLLAQPNFSIRSK